MIAAYARMCKLIGAPGAGQLTKMVNQICIAGLVQGLAEGIHFAKKAGLDIDTVIETISKGAAQSWQMENRYKTMAAGKFDFGFAVDWMRKDLSICIGEARKNGASLPVTALVDQFYAEVQKMGGKRWDTSSLIARLEIVSSRSPTCTCRKPGHGWRSQNSIPEEQVLAEAGRSADKAVTRRRRHRGHSQSLRRRRARRRSCVACSNLGAALGEQLMPQVVGLLSGGSPTGYGKAAIVGVNGDVEHGAALLHPKLADDRCGRQSAAARRSSRRTSRWRRRAPASTCRWLTRTTSGRSTTSTP